MYYGILDTIADMLLDFSDVLQVLYLLSAFLVLSFKKELHNLPK